MVVSVDGRDVLDGKPANTDKRGYIVDPYGEVVIDGYRLSEQSVAAFRFSSVSRSYAAQMGDARDVGVIGVAVFSERAPRVYSPPAYPYPPPYPYPHPFRDGPRPEVQSAPMGSGASKSEEAAPSSPSASPGAMAQRGADRSSRPGLGTEFAEEHESHVTSTQFERASHQPEAVMALRFNDRQGLLALGIDVDHNRWSRGDDTWLRETADPFRRNHPFAQPPANWNR